MLKCPDCGSASIRISVEVMCNAILEQSKAVGECLSIEPIKGCEWYYDDDSFAACNNCDHFGVVADFSVAFDK